MKEKGNNAYAYISIVAIVAIVSLFVMFAGNSKETSQPIVLSGGDVVGDAISKNNNNLIESDTSTSICSGQDSNGFCSVACDSGCHCIGSQCNCNVGSPFDCDGVCCNTLEKPSMLSY